jgi:uncharacterized protein with HEPN domain
MPFDRDSDILSDIENNIDLALQFTKGLTLEGFREDTKTYYAILRCLEIISEASRRLSDELKARHPQIPWKDIAGAGNIYRHNYHEVLHEVIWRTVRESLPALRAVVANEISRKE